MHLPFNRILFQKEDNDVLEMTAVEFLNVALQERMRAILEKRVSFMEGVEPVEPRIALRALYKAKA